MFQFRLEKIMELRRLTRDRRRAELAQAYEADKILRQQEEQLRGRLEQLKADMRQAARPGEVAVDSLLQAHRYQLLARSELRLLAERAREVANEIERRRRALLAADTDFRLVEKLREKHQHRYQQETARRQLRQLDEAALRAGRRSEAM